MTICLHQQNPYLSVGMSILARLSLYVFHKNKPDQVTLILSLANAAKGRLCLCNSQTQTTLELSLLFIISGLTPFEIFTTTGIAIIIHPYNCVSFIDYIYDFI